MEVNPGMFRMAVSHLMYALRVPYDGLLHQKVAGFTPSISYYIILQN
jgi:hypothetical protein